MSVVAKRLEDLRARYRRLLHGKRASPNVGVSVAPCSHGDDE
jgi:hypothetical protein